MEQSSLYELRALTLRDKDGATDRREIMLCTPYEYMKICKKYEKLCVPELKSNFTQDEIKDILQIFDGYLDNTCFIAFNIANLDLVKNLRPEQHCQFLSGTWDDSYPEMLKARGMGLDIVHTEVTEDRIKACHAAGVEVNAWTVDDPARAELLISWGIDYITTNILE
ncbi:MAG: hypothetical protein J6N32_12880, partial [Clostridia bacterium]|nr:hypothetical protein [Clostridia bacterium]